MSRKKKHHMDIPINEIDFDDVPSDEELEAMGDLEPINGSFEDFCGKVLFPHDKKTGKNKKEVIQ